MKHSKLTIFLLFAVFSVCGNAAPYPKPKIPNKCYDISHETENRIRTVLALVNEPCFDYNKDGVVNCQDHAVLFKIYWDKLYPRDDCEIVRNFNRGTDLNHLFVIVWDDSLMTAVPIEPWIETKNYVHKTMCMNCRWGDMYDAWYNYYDETDYWLAGNSRVTFKFEVR